MFLSPCPLASWLVREEHSQSVHKPCERCERANRRLRRCASNVDGHDPNSPKDGLQTLSPSNRSTWDAWRCLRCLNTTFPSYLCVHFPACRYINIATFSDKDSGHYLPTARRNSSRSRHEHNGRKLQIAILTDTRHQVTTRNELF
jgi:hypothetical protein